MVSTTDKLARVTTYRIIIVRHKKKRGKAS